VIALGQEEAEIQVGVMRVRAQLSDLEIPTPSGAPAPALETNAKPRKTKGDITRLSAGETENARQSLALPPSPGMELDLRGKRDDALYELTGLIAALQECLCPHYPRKGIASLRNRPAALRCPNVVNRRRRKRGRVVLREAFNYCGSIF
jgi:hypothetical protein